MFKPILAFIAIAYTVSWAIWLGCADIAGTVDIDLFRLHAHLPIQSLLRASGNIGPGVAALFLAATYGSKLELRQLLGKLVPRWKDMKWIAFALALPVSAVMVAVYWTDPSLSVFRNSMVVSHWLLVFITNLLFAPLFEEIGWRGYLLPKMQKVFTPAVASVLIGIIWGPWHAPLYADVVYPGSHYGVFPLLFFVYTVGLSIIFTWLFNISGERLFATVLLHASFNSSILAILGPGMRMFGNAPFIRLIIVVWVFGIALIYATRGGLSLMPCNDRMNTGRVADPTEANNFSSAPDRR